MSQRRPGYEVGYAKPPQYTRFRKGQSGNPKGRPKGLQSFARLARQAFNEKIAIKENGERRIITKLQAALKQLANKAASGDAAAIREVLRVQAVIAEIVPAEERLYREARRAAEPRGNRPKQDRAGAPNPFSCAHPGGK